MKIILTLLICATGLTAFGQTKYTAVVDNNLGAPILDKVEVIFNKPFSGAFKSDTLVIADPSIHFIKIGNKVFEIRRNVELVPVVEQPAVAFPKWRAVTLDSTITHTPYHYITPAINK